MVNSSPSSERATNCRWYVVAVATLMATLMYLDRFCVSFAQSFIQEDLGLTVKQTSWILSAFFWSYALAQIPSGWLSDRWGGRLMLTIYIVSWSLFTLLIGLSVSLWFLLAMQLGHGLGQAGAYPTSAGLLSHWMPLETRGVASSIVAFGGRLGGFIAPILTAWLIVMFVPVETSSQLTPRQVVSREMGAASLRLSAATDPEPGAKADSMESLLKSIYTALPQETRKLVDRLAKSQRQADESAKSPEGSRAPRTNDVATLDEAERATLVNGFNHALANPQLASAESVVGINLASEAKSLMARRDRGESLSSLETERLNRLVLEALFPKAIGKIYVLGWRKVFIVYGISGVFVALLFWVVVRNRPQEHPWCNQAELGLIQAGRFPSSNTASTQIRFQWSYVFRSRGLWLSSLSQVGTNIGWLFVLAKLPDYLEQVHHVEIIQRGYMSSLPMAAGVAGMLLGGKLTDWMRWKWGVRWGRAIPMGLTRFGAAAAYVGCLFVDDPWSATLLCMAVAFFTDLGVGAMWAFVQDAGGRYVGVVLGFGNMWGNIGAAIAPQLYGYALEWSRNDWNVCFLLCATCMTVSGIAGLMIDASQPVIPGEVEPA